MTALVLPGPRKDLLLGHFIALRRDPLRFLTDLSRSEGDAAPLRFGWIRAHLVSDPARVRHVLQDNAKAYTKQTRGFDKLRLVLGNGLLTSEGEFWLRQRRIMQPAFHRERLRAASAAMAAATLDLVKQWDRAAKSGAIIDVHHDMMALTLRIVCETLLGTASVTEKTDEIGRTVTSVVEDVNERTRVFFDVPLSVPTRRNRKLKASIAMLDGVVNRMIAEHRAALDTPAEKNDLLTLMLRARDEHTGEGMTDRQLRDEVITFFLAGHETTANALAWSFYCLSKNPSADRELARELAGRDAPPAFEEAGKLAQTNMVIKETMRLFPPAWMLGRMAEQDDDVCGMIVERGTMVFASPYVTHRHPDYWENPEGFDPSRFAPEREAARPRFAYFPFGGGPRLCIGQSFAMVEAAIVLGTLAARFRLELLPGRDVRPLPLITLRPNGPLPMRVFRR